MLLLTTLILFGQIVYGDIDTILIFIEYPASLHQCALFDYCLDYALGWILVSMYIFWVIFLGCSQSIFEAVYFSSVSLTGVSPNGLPVGAWKYAVMLESVLGYLFLALFVVVLARKMIR